MRTLLDTIAFVWTGTSRTASRHLTIVLLALVLVGVTACGSRTTAADTAESTTSLVTTTVFESPSTTTTPPTTTPPTTTPPTTMTAVTALRPTATVDELVGPAGRRVHIRCVGQGDTTVLLIAGFGGGADGWAAVEAALAPRVRVCSYERPGTGTSDPALTTATFTSQAADLHALLDVVGEAGPYVVVGHSFGGAEAVLFSSMFADEVNGLVLVDASPTTWPGAVCAVPDDGTDAATTLRGVCGMFAPTGNVEHLDAVAAFAEAATVDSLGSLPMAVITATHRELPPGLAESEVARLNDAWIQGQQDWMALSVDAHLVTVDETGHHIEIDQPVVVIEEITRLLP